MKPIPFPTGTNKELPKEEIKNKKAPAEQELTKAEPAEQKLEKAVPIETQQAKETPTETQQDKETPSEPELNKEMPSDTIPENCVKINNELVELKPTKLKYFRNKMALNYGLIKAVPLNEFLAYGKGTIDQTKDADQILYDFLVAAFDDSTFVRDNYDEMTADDVERVIQIFGRLNHIDEKEEKARKNKEAQAKH